MLKFIANYTLLPGKLLINNVVSIDGGRLVQCQACDVEMANTRYVDAVLCLAPKLLITHIIELATKASSREQFIDAFLADTHRMTIGDELLTVLFVDPPYYNIVFDEDE